MKYNEDNKQNQYVKYRANGVEQYTYKLMYGCE